MSDRMMRHLEELAQKELPLRRDAMARILEQERFSYTTQEASASYKNAQGVVNYLIETGTAPGLLFCAHYDAVAGSTGANDNAAAVCILLRLADSLRERNISARFAFFDGEEAGNAGSKLYVSSMDRTLITGVINLDMCGYGDALAVCGKGHEKKPAVRAFCQRDRLKKYNGELLRYLPKSDDASFSGSRLPVLSMCMVPRWDIQYLKALATYGGGLIGRPPEYDMMLEQMEVTTTMHGGSRDSVEYIEPETMEKMYEYLLESVTAKDEEQTTGGLFGRFMKRRENS